MILRGVWLAWIGLLSLVLVVRGQDALPSTVTVSASTGTEGVEHRGVPGEFTHHDSPPRAVVGALEDAADVLNSLRRSPAPTLVPKLEIDRNGKTINVQHVAHATFTPTARSESP